MLISIESTGDIGRKINVEVPAEKLDKEFDKQLKATRGRVRIDGFRPGKVPLSVVKERYGQSVYSDVAGQIIQETLYDAIAKEELKVAGSPKVTPVTVEAGKDLKYFAELEIYPTVALADLSDLEIVQPNVEITDSDVDNMIETLRKQHMSWNNVDRTAQDKDKVTVNFTGTLDGESFDGGTAEGFDIEVGAGRMLADFETAIVGMSVDEEKKVDVTFPDDYQAENLKGKTAQFLIKVVAIQEPVLPEVNEDFIKKFGSNNTTVDSFRNEVRSNMERELEQGIKSKVKNIVMEGLAAKHDIAVPTSLVENEINLIREEMKQNTGNDTSQMPADLFRDQAERRVKLGLIVGEIINTHNIKKDDERIDAMIQSLAKSYEQPESVIEYYSTNKQARQSIEAAVMEEMIVEWVVAQAKTRDEDSDFNTLMSEVRGLIGR